MPPLNADQLDTLREVVNIGVGRAASSLNTLVGDEIAVAVPDVEFLSRQELIARIQTLTPEGVAGVRQSLRGHLTGDAMLLFEMEKSRRLATLLLHQSLDQADFDDLVGEVFTEMGNIIINAGVGAIVNMLDLELNIGLPEYQHGNIDAILDSSESANYSKSNIMLLRVSFSLRNNDIDGYIMFLLDLAGQLNLISRVNKLMEKFTGGQQGMPDYST